MLLAGRPAVMLNGAADWFKPWMSLSRQIPCCCRMQLQPTLGLADQPFGCLASPGEAQDSDNPAELFGLKEVLNALFCSCLLPTIITVES
jgi:hypothetical protein